jgi:hypothetical protein
MTSCNVTSFKKAIPSVQGIFCADSNSEKSDPMFSSGRPSKASGCSSVSDIRSDDMVIPSRHPSMSTVQACICLDVAETCPNAFQSSKRIQHSSAFVEMMWQYRLDASQCSTSKRISFADPDMGKQLQPSERQVYTIWTLSLIRQDVEKNCNRPDIRATPSERQSLLWKLCAAEVQLSI